MHTDPVDEAGGGRFGVLRSLFTVLFQHSPEHSAWAREHGVPLVGGGALAADAVAAATLILTPPGEFSSSAYQLAQQLDFFGLVVFHPTLQSWGVALACFTFMTLLLWLVQGRCKVVSFLLRYVLGYFYWGFFSLLAVISAFGPNEASVLLGTVCAFLAYAHVWAGIGWPLTDPRPLELLRRARRR